MRTRILLLLPRTATVSSARHLPVPKRFARLSSTSSSSTSATPTTIESLLTNPPSTEPALLAALQSLRQRAEASSTAKPAPSAPAPQSPTAAILSQSPGSISDTAASAGAASSTAAAAAAASNPASSLASSSSNNSSNTYPDLAFKLIQSASESKHLSLTPPILESYIRVCIASSTAAAIPAALALYAAPAPSHPRNAVPPALANLSITTALSQRDLLSALDAIDLTFGAPAFRNRKLATKALPTGLGLGVLVPTAFWQAAAALAEYQDTIPLDTARSYAFAGLAAYGLFTGGIGMMAFLTRNDQMRRVRWAPGTPLRERWVREEERWALDEVAVRWGFQERERWGEEQGEEWVLLKETIGRKGMVLDVVQSMPGMG